MPSVRRHALLIFAGFTNHRDTEAPRIQFIRKASRWLSASVVCVVVLALPVAGAGTAAAQTVLPSVIPIFPLPDATLFPNASYRFHIFEPRYRAMVADALAGNKVIGMVALRPGYEADYEGRPPIFPIGCAGLILDYEELPDGRYNIMLGGLTKFRVDTEDETRPYRLARVTAISEVLDDAEIEPLRKQRQRLEGLLTALTPRLGIAVPPNGADDEGVVDVLAQYLPMAPPNRQRLLEAPGAVARAGAIIRLLEQMLPAAQARAQ